MGLSDLVSNLVGKKSVGNKKSTGNDSLGNNETGYTLRNNNSGMEWYRSWPYAFIANMDGQKKIFYLPIAPQNLNIVTNFATNIIATLYSTVEEHSEVRYYDITIQGTTGFVPTYHNEYNYTNKINTSGNTRKNYGASILGQLEDSGFMKRTVALIKNVQNTASDIKGSRKHESGVFVDNNGYIAFHNFYRFLLEYKKSTVNAKTRSKDAPLTFMNYKDNNQYSCVIQRFVLERNAENPMLYNYSIQMRAYNLKTISDDVSSKDLQDRYESLGLKETSKSLAAKMAEKVRLAKNGVNAARNLVGSVGR